ncbi:YkvA family protein [Gottschalkiaceae bacterium SANA]|nr:YkvA family protein [Gottschalkiaceae bacterium SANA]
MRIREWAKKIKLEISVLAYASKHKDMSLVAKGAILLTLAYALSPIDLIPDFIPVLGYLDDLILLPLMIAGCIRLIPENVMEESRVAVENREGEPLRKRWVYALPIVLLWCFIIWKISGIFV